jgi:hypothetical protein
VTPPHDEHAHFLARRATHVICCSLRPGHKITGNDRMTQREAQAKAAEMHEQSGGKTRYWTEPCS